MSAETLRRAAAIVRERGWTQHALRDGDGRVCATGAIHAAASGYACRCTDQARDAEAAMRDHVGRYLVGWNDAPGRTADEVVAALEAAAARLEATS